MLYIIATHCRICKNVTNVTVVFFVTFPVLGIARRIIKLADLFLKRRLWTIDVVRRPPSRYNQPINQSINALLICIITIETRGLTACSGNL